MDKGNDENTRYRIASVTKMFTACLTMMLVEQKKLTLETKLNVFYPDIVNSENITIDNLLRHSSGISNYLGAEDYIDPNWVEQFISKDSLLRKIELGGSVFEPNEKTEYSNSNYVLLTFIIEKIQVKSFTDHKSLKFVRVQGFYLFLGRRRASLACEDERLERLVQ